MLLGSGEKKKAGRPRQGDHRFGGDRSNRSSRREKRRKARGGEGNRKRKMGEKSPSLEQYNPSNCRRSDRRLLN